ncbi:hypothetical protein ACF090_36735 [Streptomyces sp. NPDC014892]|uniref:hypothetical protein n=1 Tax=Streptomyces sp. NPDC014892 TaxID=3364930 RepID=UPI0036FEC463
MRTCEKSARQATADRERRTAATGRALAEAEHAGRLAAELDAAVSRDAAAVADHAHTAGLRLTPADTEPDRLAERSAALAAARHEGVRTVRAAQQVARGAEQTHGLARVSLDRAQEAVTAAEAAETDAESALEGARENPQGEAVIPTAARITAVLRSVAVTGDPCAGIPHIGPDGRYAAGVLVGAHTKEHAEYVGATARARRRAARIAACETLLAELASQMEELERAQARADAALDAYAAALPRTTGITQALRQLDRAAARLRATRDAADAAQGSYDESVAACSVVERALRRTAAEHAIETDRVDAVETATRAFETAVRELAARRREHARQTGAAQAAADRLTAAAEDEGVAADTERAARRRHAEEAAGLEALQEAVGAEAQEVMRQVRETEDGIDALFREAEAARTAQHGAIAYTAAAEARRTAATEAREVAAAEEKDTARSLRPYAARGLLDILRCPPARPGPPRKPM